jgi:hypothetical protein
MATPRSRDSGLGFFAVRQAVDGITDRQAVGSELRYFKDLTSVFGLLDYDTQLWPVECGIGAGLVPVRIGRRAQRPLRLPPHADAAGLQRPARRSHPDRWPICCADLRRQDTLERLALGLTPVSKVALAGVTWPVSGHWQLGGEFRVSSLTGTEGFGALPAQAGTGNVYTGTLQAIGSGVFTETGVVTLTSSRLSADAYDAWLLAANSRFRIGSRWIVEPSMRWYRQDNVAGSQLTRVAPTLRMLFQWREHFSLEGEVAYERSSQRVRNCSTRPTTSSSTTSASAGTSDPRQPGRAARQRQCVPRVAIRCNTNDFLRD